MGTRLGRALLVDAGAADYHSVPDTTDAPTGPAGADVSELGSRLDKTDHAHGYCCHSVDWHIGRHRDQNATRSAIGGAARDARAWSATLCGPDPRATSSVGAPCGYRDFRSDGGAGFRGLEDTRPTA